METNYVLSNQWRVQIEKKESRWCVGQGLAEVNQMHFRDGELCLDRLFKGLQLRLWVSRPNFVNGSARSLSYIPR